MGRGGGDRTFHPPIGSLNFLHSWKISLKSVTPLTSQSGTGPYFAAATGLCRKSAVEHLAPHRSVSHPPSSSLNSLTAARIVSFVIGGQRA